MRVVRGERTLKEIHGMVSCGMVYPKQLINLLRAGYIVSARAAGDVVFCSTAVGPFSAANGDVIGAESTENH